MFPACFLHMQHMHDRFSSRRLTVCQIHPPRKRGNSVSKFMNQIIRNAEAVLPDGIRTVDIAIDNGQFVHAENCKSDKIIDASGFLAVPGFIDTHIHGYGGYGTEDCDPDSILAMSELLLKEGVTSFFPTVYTDKEEKMLSAIEAIAKAAGKEHGASISGIHVEGPFISKEKIGAQAAEGRHDPDIMMMRRIIEAGNGLVKAMTIAPELPDTDKIVRIAEEYGIVLLMGHTNASYDEALMALSMGIHHTTHMYNAMSGINHRNPGAAGCALMHDTMYAEIIADGIHVNKDLALFTMKAKGKDRTILITDALKPTGQIMAPFTANGTEVVLRNGAWVSKENTGLLEGSALTMHKAFRNAVSWGLSIEAAAAASSSNPACLYSMKDRGSIEYGKTADFLLLDRNLNISRIFHKGEQYVVQQS